MADPYRWLEDGESAECLRWLDEQDALFTRHGAEWPSRDWFRATLDEVVRAGSAAAPVAAPPVWRGTRRFYLQRRPSQPLPVLMVADGDAAARPLVDPTEFDPSAATTLDAWRPSRSGHLLAYQVSRGGSERPSLWVASMPDGRTVDGPLTPGRRTPVAWLPADDGFYYVMARAGGAAGRQVRLHRIGTDPGDDATVFETDQPQLTMKTSADGRWLMLSCSGGATSGNTLWLAPLDPARPHAAEPRLIHDGSHDGARAVLKFGPDATIHAATDAGAPYGKLCAVDPADPGSASWRTLVGEQPPAVLSDSVALADPGTGAVRILVCRTRHGISEMALHDGDGTPISGVALPGAGTVSQLTAPRGGADAWFSYTDYVTPPTVYRFRLRDRRCVPDRCVPDAEAPAKQPGASGDAPAVREVSYRSSDGTPVRMHLVGPSDAAGPLPTLLTGYGGFGASTTPAYSPTLQAWIRAGGRYAVAHVRGGGEEGTGWHAAGRGHNKPNAVADLTAAAQWLVEHGWTTPAQLAVKGASHSGLLAAAALTRRPDLYAAVVCSDAVTDMVRYQHFGIGHLWTEEFGTAADPAELDTLLSYSPYHGVRRGTEYPAVLLTCPRVDPRVDSLHTRKLTAALQHATSSARPVVLRCEGGVGHGPGSAAQWVGLQADVLAFCAAHTGLDPSRALR